VKACVRVRRGVGGAWEKFERKRRWAPVTTSGGRGAELERARQGRRKRRKRREQGCGI
jgi:hypothetical protein